VPDPFLTQFIDVGRFCMPDLDNMSDSLKEEFEDLKDRFY